MPLVTSFFRLPGRWRRRRARKTRMALQLLTLALLVIIVFPAYVVYRQPRFVVNALQKRFPSVLFRLPNPTSKVVALTIDDTPSEYTREILAILRTNRAAATFFAIGGQVPGRESILQDILKSGSELGNHAMHDEPSISLESEILRSEIETVNGYINAAYEEVNQQRIGKYFRPGSGFFSTRILDIVAKADYRTILGDVYPHDPFIKYWRINAWHILSMVRPGSIIICHDRRSWTVPMLKKVIPELRRQGYAVVTVSQLLKAAGT